MSRDLICLEDGAVEPGKRERLRSFLGQDGLTVGWLIFSFVLASLLIFSRCPSLFTHPQFYAEDGQDWFAQAYNLGWLHTLTIPYMGYLTTVQRLAGAAAMLVPFRVAPLILAIVGLLLQAAPVPLLLSPQLRGWAPLPSRIAFAGVYVAIPNAHEIHVVCTNSQWHLALIMAFLTFADAPRTLWAKLLTAAVIALGALTGPFAILLLPLAAVFWYVRRCRWTAIVTAILFSGAALQLLMLLTHSSQRPARGYLGASVPLFIRLLGGNCFIGALLGTHRFGLRLPLACSVCMLVIGLCLCAYCARFLRAEMRLFFIFCFLVFLAGIRMPALEPNPEAMWGELLNIPSQRYLFFPSLPLLFAILWCAGYARDRVVRVAAAALTLILCVGIWMDWGVPSIPAMDLRQQAAILRAAKPGQHVILPVYPAGWYMDLIKR